MAQPYAVEIRGLQSLRRGLRAMAPELRRGLDKELKAAAAPIVAEAKRRYRVEHPRRRGGRGSQRGIRASAGGGKVRVILGSTRYPYLTGQEHGSGRYPQFPRPTKKGYFFWPAVRDGTKDLVDKVEDIVDRSTRTHFEGR